MWASYFNTPSTPAGAEVVRYISGATLTDISLRITFRASRQLTIYGGHTDILRLNIPQAQEYGVAEVFCVTFSVDEGLKVFKNGELIGENPDDRRPLTSFTEPGALVVMRSPYTATVPAPTGAYSNYGRMFFMNVDLGKDENEPFRDRLFASMIRKYLP